MALAKYPIAGEETNAPPIEVVAVRMGYGHLRPAHAMAELAGVPIRNADAPPLIGTWDRIVWSSAQTVYEGISRLSEVPLAAQPASAALRALTRIPGLGDGNDLSKPDRATRWLSLAIRRGFGRRLSTHLGRRDAVLVSTFYAPALAAATHGSFPVLLVVTDTEVARAWVEERPVSGRIIYCVPADITKRRLMGYGVPERRIRLTGFPLPPSLAEEDVARRFLEERCRRLRTQEVPAHVALAVGGAGAQARLALEIAQSLLPLAAKGRIRLTLVAGTRPELGHRFRKAAESWAGTWTLPERAVSVLQESKISTFFSRFNRLLEEVDLLWTKPSELVFFAALGLPLLLAPPLGAQEFCNRRWLHETGVGVDQPVPQDMASWMEERITNGGLEKLARLGFEKLPRRGAWRVLEEALGLVGAEHQEQR